jgi:hypothetical protein
MERMAARRRIEVSGVAASKRFGRYKDELEKTRREAQVDGSVVSQLMEAFRSLQMTYPVGVKMYPRSMELLRGLTPSPRTVERACIALREFQGERDFQTRAGVFLSALINGEGFSENEALRLDLRHLDVPLNYMGLRNRRNLVLIGDVGDKAGYKMESGSILVEGDAGDKAGLDLSGGKLIIHGDVGIKLGEWMRGGEIHVHGRKKSKGLLVISGHLRGGRIYHRGKLVVDMRGKLVVDMDDY